MNETTDNTNKTIREGDSTKYLLYTIILWTEKTKQKPGNSTNLLEYRLPI